MGADEKTRASGESPREASGPILPTVNPEVEKPQAPAFNVHPAFYVA
jgi:hypothetical protein